MWARTGSREGDAMVLPMRHLRSLGQPPLSSARTLHVDGVRLAVGCVLRRVAQLCGSCGKLPAQLWQVAVLLQPLRMVACTLVADGAGSDRIARCMPPSAMHSDPVTMACDYVGSDLCCCSVWHTLLPFLSRPPFPALPPPPLQNLLPAYTGGSDVHDLSKHGRRNTHSTHVLLGCRDGRLHQVPI